MPRKLREPRAHDEIKQDNRLFDQYAGIRRQKGQAEAIHARNLSALDADDSYTNWRDRNAERVKHNPIFLSGADNAHTEVKKYGYNPALTNANWIPSHELCSISDDIFVRARGMQTFATNDDGSSMRLDDAQREFGLFNFFDYYSQAKIKVGREKTGSKWDTWIGNIRKGDLASIQANPTDSLRFMVFDIDRADAYECVMLNPHLPQPSYFVETVESGHGHAVYAIKNPVYHGENSTTIRPLKYWRHVNDKMRRALGADLNYTGFFTKNPFCPDYVTHWGSQNNVYSLRELEEHANEALDAGYSYLPEFIDPYRFDESKRPEEDGSKAAKTVRNVRTMDEQIVGRNNTIFNIVRKFAYQRRRSARSLDEWSSLIFAKCAEVNSHLAMMSEFSDRGKLDNKELASIARSIATWTWKRESFRDGEYTDEQRKKSVATRQSASFDALVRKLKSLFSARGRKRYKRLRVNKKRREITLPENVTLREVQRLWRREYNETMQTRLLSHLHENISDFEMIASDRERIKRMNGLRSLSQLSNDEVMTILEEAMVSPLGYADLEQNFVLERGVLKRIVQKYRNTPWLLIGESAPIDKRTRELLQCDAQARWRSAVRNGGSFEKPFDESPSMMDADTYINSRDEIILRTSNMQRFDAMMHISDSAIQQRQATRASSLWSMIRLFCANVITVGRIADGNFVVDSTSMMSDALKQIKRQERARYRIDDLGLSPDPDYYPYSKDHLRDYFLRRFAEMQKASEEDIRSEMPDSLKSLFENLDISV